MTTYHQEKLGLIAYYEKRRVLPDGIHTQPIEYRLVGLLKMQHPIRRQLSARRHDQQLFANKTAGRPLSEIVQRGLTSLPNHIAH